MLLIGTSAGSANIGGPPGLPEDGRPVDVGGEESFLLRHGDRTWVNIPTDESDYVEFAVGRGISDDELVRAANGAEIISPAEQISDNYTATIAADAVPPGLEPLVTGAGQDGPFTLGGGMVISVIADGGSEELIDLVVSSLRVGTDAELEELRLGPVAREPTPEDIGCSSGALIVSANEGAFRWAFGLGVNPAFPDLDLMSCARLINPDGFSGAAGGSFDLAPLGQISGPDRRCGGRASGRRRDHHGWCCSPGHRTRHHRGTRRSPPGCGAAAGGPPARRTDLRAVALWHARSAGHQRTVPDHCAGRSGDGHRNARALIDRPRPTPGAGSG